MNPYIFPLIYVKFDRIKDKPTYFSIFNDKSSQAAILCELGKNL